jgi:hypothetical protein
VADLFMEEEQNGLLKCVPAPFCHALHKLEDGLLPVSEEFTALFRVSQFERIGLEFLLEESVYGFCLATAVVASAITSRPAELRQMVNALLSWAHSGRFNGGGALNKLCD